MPYSHAHYGGNLVDGAYVLGLFGDVATEVSIRADADEGLFASYSDIQFKAPVLAGDVLEVVATITRVGRRSRELSFEARVLCRAEPERGPSAARVLDEPARRGHRDRHRRRAALLTSGGRRQHMTDCY